METLGTILMDKNIALNVTEENRVRYTYQVKQILEEFRLKNTITDYKLLQLVTKVMEINTNNEINDEDWIVVVNVLYSLRKFFYLRKVWIESKLTDFFDIFRVVQEAYR